MSVNRRCYGFLEINPVRSICTQGLIMTLELVVKSTPADAENAGG
jgi:hypothetical protein